MFSIITPCLNRATMIAEAVESVLAQDYPDFEHIIMDGGSTDGTLEVLARYSHLHVVSERDEGMYAAINKGLLLAHGDIFGLLNSDDYYKPKTFKCIADLFSSQPELHAVSGGAAWFIDNSDGKRSIIRIFPSITEETMASRIGRGNPIINAWFFRRKLIEKIGPFDMHYRFSSDRDWMIRFMKAAPNFLSIKKIFYYYRQHKGSFTIDGICDPESAYNLESISIAKKYLYDREASKQLKRNLRDWICELYSAQTFNALRQRQLEKAWHSLKQGIEANDRWPIIFGQRFLNGFLRRAKTLFYFL